MLTLKKYLKSQKLATILGENKQLKEYIATKKQRFNENRQQQEEQNLLQENNFFRDLKKIIKKYSMKRKLTVNLRMKKVSTYLKTNLSNNLNYALVLIDWHMVQLDLLFSLRRLILVWM